MGTAGHRVLLVEDDAEIREALAECLASMGLEVAVAVDGLDGLAVLRSAPPPRAILVDMRMPRLDGNGFIEELRRDPRYAAVPVVSMTAWKARPSQPVYRHLEKPFDLDEMARVLGEICGAA